jgi:rRNA maturation endonuclease Nob1
MIGNPRILAYPNVSYSIDDAKEPGKTEEEVTGKIRCEYCGAIVDAKLDECPHCGAPLR